MNLTKKTGAFACFLLAGTIFASANETPAADLELKDNQDLPVQIVVSRKDQTLKVYRGTEVIATSNVSTGKRGHTTPTGIFSILEKRRRHFSNLYDSAPMPYMQRLTWSGIALHESNSVPRYPASHGCVRLPRGFAKKLFGLTERGAHVVIANRQAEPQPIQHVNLVQPFDKNLASKMASLSPQASQGVAPTANIFEEPESDGSVSLLASKPAQDPIPSRIMKQVEILEKASQNNQPIRMLITHAKRGSLVRDIQQTLNELGFDAGPVDGLAGSGTRAAIKRFVEAKAGSLEDRSFRWDGKINRALLQHLYDASGKGDVATGRLYIRQGFQPLFEAPVHIEQTGQPLGTHLFSAHQSTSAPAKLEWLALNLGDQLSSEIQSELGIEQAEASGGLVPSIDALNRIRIPDWLQHRLSKLVSSGSSLSISDKGMSFETGNGTDFIILTRPDRKVPHYRASTKKVVKKKKKPVANARASNNQRKRVAQQGLFGRLFSRNGS